MSEVESCQVYEYQSEIDEALENRITTGRSDLQVATSGCRNDRLIPTSDCGGSSEWIMSAIEIPSPDPDAYRRTNTILDYDERKTSCNIVDSDKTTMRLSVVALGGLLAHYEGVNGHPPPDEKRQIYLRASELGINLFDMGYGDEVHIPEELKGPNEDRHFSLKVGAPRAEDLEGQIDVHLKNLRREAIDILRVHHSAFVEDDQLAERIEALKCAGKVRSLCLIRHLRADQEAYAERGPEPEADADLAILQLRLPLAGAGHRTIG